MISIGLHCYTQILRVFCGGSLKRQQNLILVVDFVALSVGIVKICAYKMAYISARLIANINAT